MPQNSTRLVNTIITCPFVDFDILTELTSNLVEKGGL